MTNRKASFCTLVIVILISTQTNAATLSWDWNSGTTEGWVPVAGTVVTVETGRDGTSGLGAQQVSYNTSSFPEVEIGGQPIDPGALVGGESGEHLPMTGQIYVDANRKMNYGGGDYVDLRISNSDSHSRFHCYPMDNYGHIEDLGDGWYRHYFSNRFHYLKGPPGPSPLLDGGSPVSTIRLEWNWNFNTREEPIVFDNFTIILGSGTVDVAVDIKPDSCPNPVNVRSKGVLPVAILGSANLDVTTIDVDSIELAGVSPVRSRVADVATPAADNFDGCECATEGPDGFADLTLKFKTQDIVETLGRVNHGEVVILELTGALFDGTEIRGDNCITIRGKAKTD